MSKTVLISFIGKGRGPRRDGRVSEETISRTGYERTTYTFPATESGAARTVQKAVFGAAFLSFRLESQTPVDRWLVMGTAQANWADLLEALPVEPEEITPLYCEVQDAVRAEAVTQPLLDRWQTALNVHLAPAECCFRLVGAGETEESQLAQWQAMLDTVGNHDSVVLDITHSFRHHPVMAGFMVMLLRWLKHLKRVDLYYGAYELASGEQRARGESPVLHLPLCNELLVATEAVATYRHTGNYVPLADCAGLSRRTKQNVRTLRFRDQTNREHLEAVQTFLHALKDEPATSLQTGLVPALEEAVRWSTGHHLAERMAQRVKSAYRHQNYFEATALLWETLRVAGCCCYPHLAGRPLDSHEIREEAEALLRQRLNTVFKDPAIDCDSFKQLEDLRNAVVHGTRPRTSEVRKALEGPDQFAQLFKKGLSLLDQLLEKCRTCASSTSPTP